jgi:hypothetical protein
MGHRNKREGQKIQMMTQVVNLKLNWPISNSESAADLTSNFKRELRERARVSSWKSLKSSAEECNRGEESWRASGMKKYNFVKHCQS